MKAKASRRALLEAVLRGLGANSSLPPWPRSSPAASSTPLAGAPLSSTACALKPSTLVNSRAMGPLRKTGGLGGRMKEAVPAWLPCLPEPAQPAARTAINKTHKPGSRTSASRNFGQRPITHFNVDISLGRISEPICCKSKQIRAQISGAAGQDVAQAGAASEGKQSAETPVNGGVCHGLAQGDAVGEMERAKGFEPSTLTLAT